VVGHSTLHISSGKSARPCRLCRAAIFGHDIVSLFGRWPVANRATQVGGWPVFTWPNVPATGLTSQAHVDAPLIGSATLNAEISRLTYVSQLVESNKGAIFAARERR
jgi:hypothetical protein